MIEIPFLLRNEVKIIISMIMPETINNFGPRSWVIAINKKPKINRIIVASFGTSKLFTLSPSNPTIAGKSVTPAKTATKTTTIAPVPNA